MRTIRLPRQVTPPGNDVAVWARHIAEAPPCSLDSIAAPGTRLLVLSAHPDDETIGGGRLVARWSRVLGPVHAVVLSAGEACVAHLDVDVPGLAARRTAEWHHALDELGAAPVATCGMPDGRLGEEHVRIRSVLSGLVGPDDVVLAPWRYDPHPDHIAVGTVAAEVAAERGAHLIEYPVWASYRSDPGLLEETRSGLCYVPTDALDDQAWDRALHHYTSQCEPLLDTLDPVLPRDFFEHHLRQILVSAS